MEVLLREHQPVKSTKKRSGRQVPDTTKPVRPCVYRSKYFTLVSLSLLELEEEDEEPMEPGVSFKWTVAVVGSLGWVVLV